MKTLPIKSRAAFTLVEMITSVGCGSLILAAIVAAGICLQRSFAAVEGYSIAEGDQLRVIDYIAMDCRRATSASIVSSQLQLTIPNYYDGSGNPVTPTLSSSAISYGSGTTTVTYGQSGTNFVRTVGGTSTTIAKNVSTFTVTPQDLTTTVSCTIMFFPTFTHMTGTGTWRSGPSAPASSLGANSDWYVIDPTSSSSSTVGNVYYKSGGAYSLIENVKATTVYCNTFLRNAGARQ